MIWKNSIKESCSNRAMPSGDVDLMRPPVWIFLLKIYFPPVELKMQIAGLSCLHADVCKNVFIARCIGGEVALTLCEVALNL